MPRLRGGGAGGDPSPLGRGLGRALGCWTAAALLGLGAFPGEGRAQGLPGLDPTGRSGDRPPLERAAPPARAAEASQILPPIEPAPPARPLEPLPRQRVLVREIRFVGNTVLADEELAALAAAYRGRELSAEDLEELRLAVTRRYVERGFVSSGAIIPEQTVTEGLLTVQIVEGAITRIDLEGLRWFRPGYLRQRLALGAGPPVNVHALQQQIQLLLEDPRIERLHAELRPGVAPGEAVLGVRVEERSPWRLWVEADNYQAPAVGAERGVLALEHRNLTGWGDVLALRYGRSEGLDPLLDVHYAVPITPRDTTVALRYRRNDLAVVEEPFGPLEIETESDIGSLTLRHPVYRTIQHEVALEITAERLSSKTSILGAPFSLEPGARNGRSTVAALRLAGEWVYRTQAQVLAARSRLSLGVDALGATVHAGGDATVADGRFFAWLAQVQWARRLPVLDAQLIARADLQLAADPLLTLERMAVGGRYSVRGYRENTLVRDNGLVASIEARVPLVRNARWADTLEVAPFLDFGQAWNTRGGTPDPRSISSVGVGLRWGLTLRAWPRLRTHVEVYWGHALRDVPTPGGDLQDDGVHFQVVVGFF